MKSKDLPNGKIHVSKKSVEEVSASQLERKVKPADIIWVKNYGGSWWPAQVVDENLVSESSKPSKRSAGKVLVRLYGSYTYSYVDPIKCHSEFNNILKQNNNSHREIFLKALEQDVARLKAKEPKRQKSKSKVTKDEMSKNGFKRGKAKDEVKGKSRKQSNIQGADEGEGKSRKRKIKQDGTQTKPQPNDQNTGEAAEAANNTTPKHDKVLKKSKLDGSDSLRKSFICKVSRTKRPKTQSDAKSWLGCSDWISVLQKWTDLHYSMRYGHSSFSGSVFSTCYKDLVVLMILCFCHLLGRYMLFKEMFTRI